MLTQSSPDEQASATPSQPQSDQNLNAVDQKELAEKAEQERDALLLALRELVALKSYDSNRARGWAGNFCMVNIPIALLDRMRALLQLHSGDESVTPPGSGKKAHGE